MMKNGTGRRVACIASVLVLALVGSVLASTPQAYAEGAGAAAGTLARNAAQRIDAGGDSTCAIDDDDVLRCWGRNDSGQLGDGTTLDRPAPVEVQLDGRPVAVSVGGSSACAVLASGTLQCWGSNSHGQAGTGNVGPPASPTTVAGLPGSVRDVAVGLEFVCAVVDGGEVWCWGNSDSLRLGQEFSGPQPQPQQVSGVTNAVAIAAGRVRACALLVTGSAICWGRPAGEKPASLPAAAPGFPNAGIVAFATAGSLGDCAILDSGQARCGSGVDIVSNATSIATGRFFTCATAAGLVHCMGRNSLGQLGVGSTDRTSGVPVAGISNAVAVTVGLNHGCAVLADGEVRCWGDNNLRQVTDPLGGGDSLPPVRVEPLLGGESLGVQSVAVGRDHTCILVVDSQINRCVGANDADQLTTFNDPFERTFRPPAFNSTGVNVIADWVAVDAREDQTCALTSEGEQYCWGSGPVGDFDFMKRNYTRADTVEVSLGGQHQCLRRTTYVPVSVPGEASNFGYLRCWGSNSSGQVGVSGADSYATTQRVLIPNVTTVQRIDTGASHTCALGDLRDDPEAYVYCWGDSSNGAIGPRRPAFEDHQPQFVRLSPIGDGDALDVATGSVHSCAVSSLRGLYCWGRNDFGQLGRPTSETSMSASPLLLGGLSASDRVYAGYSHNCVVDTSGVARCWGQNDHGQLGDGTRNSTHIPQEVTLPGGGAVRAMALGPEHTCAVTFDDELYCWGDGDNGELGTLAIASTPRTVQGLRVTPVGPEPVLCQGLEVTIDMNRGASGVGTAGDDVILGTPGDDMIDAGDGADTVCAGDGNDVVLAGNGDDTVLGEGGRDILRGGPGADEVHGGDGNDRVLGGIGNDTMTGGSGNDYLGGFGGADTIDGGEGNERIFGGFGADVINGGPGNDVISGLVGDDTISGGPGNDTLNGDRGNDVIDGDAGNDTINGGNANDILSGGAGDDSVNGGRADDQLSGGADDDACAGNKQNIADTTDGTCELEFGIP